jgi:hypothetical protein
MAVGLDDPISPELVEKLLEIPNLLSARVTKFS